MSDSGERPLVTFALFAYNQEKYIREAVEGALAQDYEPLEIIISDDCSTDQTLSVIQHLVESYQGPHRVVARQTAKNVGTLLHVADVAKSARGELLVLAAGDDVSKANRVTVLQEAWKRTGAWGLSSRFDRIDAEGALLARDVKAAVIESHGFEKYFLPHDGAVRVVHGCTSAYDARVFDYLELAPDDYVLAEDGAISVLLNLIGREIVHLDESLVLYRESPDSLTNNIGRRALSYAEVVRDERNIERFAGAQANRCRLFLRMNKQLGHVKVSGISMAGVETDLTRLETASRWYGMPIMANRSELFIKLNDKFGTKCRQLNTELILSDLIKQRMREKWRETGLRDKIVYLKNNFSYAEMKWALPRILPMPIFFLIKAFIKKMI